MIKRSEKEKLSATVPPEELTAKVYFRSMKRARFCQNKSFVDSSTLYINKISVFTPPLMYRKCQKCRIYPRLNKPPHTMNRLAHQLSPAPYPSPRRFFNLVHQQNHSISPMNYKIRINISHFKSYLSVKCWNFCQNESALDDFASASHASSGRAGRDWQVTTRVGSEIAGYRSLIGWR